MKFHPRIAPIKAAVFPLVKKDGMPEIAQQIYRQLKSRMPAFYDEKGAVGRRYRRQDEAGTPYLRHRRRPDASPTRRSPIRDRDTLEQWRVKVDDVVARSRKGSVNFLSAHGLMPGRDERRTFQSVVSDDSNDQSSVLVEFAVRGGYRGLCRRTMPLRRGVAGEARAISRTPCYRRGPQTRRETRSSFSRCELSRRVVARRSSQASAGLAALPTTTLALSALRHSHAGRCWRFYGSGLARRCAASSGGFDRGRSTGCGPWCPHRS